MTSSQQIVFAPEHLIWRTSVPEALLFQAVQRAFRLAFLREADPGLALPAASVPGSSLGM